MKIPVDVIVARLSVAHTSDAELLGRFVASADGAAFAELVRRYGPLVWRVARSGTRHSPAAEDVFQATFLALVRHAAAVRRADALAGWLHRTAYRLALLARRAERLPTPLPNEPLVPDDPLDRMTARELLAAVDEEIQVLPIAYRTAIVLCGVQGLSHAEAATRLGWSVGSVKGRLERARARLRVRLEARGLAPAVLLGLAGQSGGAGAVPPHLSEAVLAAARGDAASPVAGRLAGWAVGPTVGYRWAVVAAVTICAVGLAVAVVSRPGSEPAPEPPGLGAERQTDGSVWSASLSTDPDDPDQPSATAGVWAPDGKHVLTAGSTRVKGNPRMGEVRVWDAATGAVVHTFRGSATGYDTGCPTLAVRPDGKAVAAGGMRAKSGSAEFFVEEWDWGEEKPRAKLGPDLDAAPIPAAEPPPDRSFQLGRTDNSPSGFVGSVTGLSYSPDGKLLVAACADRYLRVWDRAKGIFVLSLRTERPIRCVAFHPTGAVAVTDDRTGVRFYNPKTGETASGWSSNRPPGCASIAFSPDGKHVAAAGGVDGQSLLVQVKQINPQPHGYLDIGLTAGMPTGPVDLGGVEQVAWAPDGSALALACRDGTVRLIPFGSGRLRAVVPAHKGWVYATQFSPDGTRLLTVGRDAVKVWSLADLMKAK
ncbi:sigma-70 family rna polymerase sigma factor : Uncultured bacterium genome assembly Metasoil_fosmids_resub OS=uncultured bacterium PE=4 SV=1: Sigma70_r2: Sigma70_r4_2: WD40: WD40: WD40 [Gemmata massiliana]|uniref:ECF RNA polymerase sigma factor SigE n=1 Tax=Gemmata massiliana TaxID=1210884 RepID=A0A6P2CZH4_9BACT|nr:sigma-70 family RNA polymerase sigma factor [Gemmata massiliana]VTR92620.1 sigma-70 family rna polymerase sigma factor : Uncultured bacterium genome assembly Metasoil_fosmids_resub OS=uncultured bacterium PE=4 SV=1: Sigma70_r2: Sigma70_r4_2: WD40: WD40: WD40 [Gemmata massiliana]